ncbi:MAG TPA: YidC/Oxa1 family membrane protein insertase [Anaerolineae bacterium]|jgi:YidC/Oxa1 family membrane protein insertase|nr:YidC/Oxa1 family membrane protein insertase [Anaerolineae bacterium]
MSIFGGVFAGILGSLIGFVGDWFIGIALLTVAIKVLLLPLSIKQQRGLLLTQNFSQAKTLLDKKFKNKPDKVNDALMKIMSRHKVNPLSSIMTMLVQLPVFFSLYFSISHLSTTVGSIVIPWALSMSKADSLHILPVAASAIQGLQGLFGPTAQQTRNIIMLLLPIGLGLFFLWGAPAGLSVYWAFNAIFSLVEKKIFSLQAIRDRYLSVPSADEMVKSIA